VPNSNILVRLAAKQHFRIHGRATFQLPPLVARRQGSFLRMHLPPFFRG
jgi:hypothetical protein